jgi:hypothetical protein
MRLFASYQFHNFPVKSLIFGVLIYLFLQDDDHGYVVGTAIQKVQRPLESTGKKIYLRVETSSAHSKGKSCNKMSIKLERKTIISKSKSLDGVFYIRFHVLIF